MSTLSRTVLLLRRALLYCNICMSTCLLAFLNAFCPLRWTQSNKQTLFASVAAHFEHEGFAVPMCNTIKEYAMCWNPPTGSTSRSFRCVLEDVPVRTRVVTTRQLCSCDNRKQLDRRSGPGHTTQSGSVRLSPRTVAEMHRSV